MNKMDYWLQKDGLKQHRLFLYQLIIFTDQTEYIIMHIPASTAVNKHLHGHFRHKTPEADSVFPQQI